MRSCLWGRLEEAGDQVDGIFISYRRDDSPAWAGRLADALVGEFGRERVFIDVDDIPLGADFVDHVNRTLEECSVVVAIVGPRWVVEFDDRRRSGPDEDFVVLEIAAAMARGIPVIPVLVDDASMPRANDLPEQIRAFWRMNSLEITHEAFRDGTRRLADELEEAIRARSPNDGSSSRQRTPDDRTGRAVEKSPRPRRWALGVLLAVGILAAVAAAVALRDEGSSGDGGDPAMTATGRVVATIRVGNRLVGVTATSDAVWVTNATESSVTRIDPFDGQIVDTVEVGGRPEGIAANGESVWVTSVADGTVSRIEGGSNQVVATVDVGLRPFGVAATPDAAWVTSFVRSGAATRVDSATNRPSAVVEVGHSPVGVAAAGGVIWVANNVDGTVSRIGLDGQVGATIDVGRRPYGVAATRGAVWVTNREDDAVSRIDPATNEVVATIDVGGDPEGVAASDDAVWVANRQDDTVSRIDPATNAVIATIAVGDNPLGVAVSDGAVWVTNAYDGTVSHIDPDAT